MSDRKHMKKVRKKKKEAMQKQIEKHEDKIKNEEGRLDTTQDYWKGEIEKKFSKELEETEEYLEKH